MKETRRGEGVVVVDRLNTEGVRVGTSKLEGLSKTDEEIRGRRPDYIPKSV